MDFNAFFADYESRKPKELQAYKEKWYQGDAPTYAETLGRIYSMKTWDDKSRVKANMALGQLRQMRSDPSSAFYDPYAGPTSQAVRNLQSLGFDTSVLDDEWRNNNMSSVQSRLMYNGTTGTPSKPGKNDSADKHTAYWIYKYYENEGQTKKAEEEWARLQKNIRYWTNAGDRNLSDDDVIAKVKENFATEYPTLAKMAENQFDPVQLNRAIGYSDDALHGVVWAARNNYDGDLESAMAYSYLGRGNQYQEDPAITAKLTYGSDEYSPYSVGSTMEKQRAYFGVDKFDRKWLEDNKVSIMGGNDETAKQYWLDVRDAIDYTEKLNAQLAEMNKEIDYMIGRDYSAKKIIETIFENTEAYGDLFDLDETMETARLKNTSDAVNYRKADIEAYINGKCAERDERPTVVGVATGYITDTNSSFGAKQEEDYKRTHPEEQTQTAPASQEQKPFTETEIAQEEQTVRDMDDIGPAVDDVGTGAEKTAIETGKTSLYDEAVSVLKDWAGDYAAKLGTTVQDRIQYDYPEAVRTINDYESHQNSREELQADLDEVNTELSGLTERYQRMKAFSDMDPDEYANFWKLVDLKGNETWDYFRGILEDGEENHSQDDYQRELYDQALGYLYQAVRPDDYSYDVDLMREHAKEWWDLYQQASDTSPLLKLAQEVNQTNDDTDEVEIEVNLPKTGDAGEDDDTALMVTFERASNGTFVFAGAKGNRTGKEYGRTEANELLGYEPYDASTGMTEEEIERMGILSQTKTELEGKIQSEDDYLAANEEMFNEAQMDRNTIREVAKYKSLVSAISGEDASADMMDNIDNVFAAMNTPFDPNLMYLPYSYYDMQAENGQIDKAQAAKLSVDGAVYCSDMIASIDKGLAEMEAAGIELTDEERKTVEKNRALWEKQSKSFAYASLNNDPEFEQTAESGLEKAQSGDYGRIARAIATGRWDFDAMDWITGLFGSQEGFIERGNYEEMLQSMTEDEKNRFFYLLESDGQQAAEDYFRFIADPQNGELTVRTSADVAQRTKEFASKNLFNAAVATGASFIGKQMGNASATTYRALSWLTGQEASAYNPAFWMSNATGGMRQGSKKFLQNVFGENAITDRVYDVLTGLGDIALTSGEMKAIGAAFEGTKLAGLLKKSADWLNSNKLGQFAVTTAKDAASILPLSFEAWNNTYQQVFDQTKDADKANQMAGLAFISDLVSHTVIMKGLHRTFNADPNAFSSKLSAYMYQTVMNANTAGFSTLVTEAFTERAEKEILGAMSTWGQIYQKYKDQHYPDSMAERLADQEVWGQIWQRTIDSEINSVIRTGVTIGVKEFQDRGGFRELGKEIKQVASSAKNAAVRGLNQLFPEKGEGISYDASEGQILDADGNPVEPGVSGYLENYADDTAKDLSIINSTSDATNTAAAVSVTAVLDNPDPSTGKAAGQLIVGDIAGGSPNAATALMTQLVLATPNPAEMKSDVVMAALTSGNGNAALRAIMDKVSRGETVTAEDVTALHSGVQNDQAADPEGFQTAISTAVKENRIANATVRIASMGENKNKLLKAGKAALEAKQKANEAKRFMERKQDEAEAAASNLMAVEEQYDPGTNPETGGPLQQQTEKLMGADVARLQAEDAYQIQQQKAEEAQAALTKTRNEVMTDARQEATVQVEQKMAGEQAERDAQALQAADAEQQRNALMQQEAEAEAADNNAFLESARTKLQERGYTAEFADAQAQRMLERRTMLKRGEVNTDSMLSEEDGKSFLRSISRQTGMTFSEEDLGDPLVFRGYINNKNDIVLNSNLSKGQALVEAALHETIHGIEDTGAYVPFSDVALKILYKGDNGAMDRDILKKMREYASFGKELTIAGAKQEIVADYARLNMANKKFIRKVVARGAGSDTRKALGRSVSLLKGYKFKGATKRQADLYRKAERLYTEAIDERARMVKEGYNGHTGITQASITSASQAAGLTVEVTDDEQYRYKLYDKEGNELEPGAFKPEMLEGTPVGRVIEMPAIALRDELDKKVKDGLITRAEADKRYNDRLPSLEKAANDAKKFMTDMINMIGKYQDAAMVWELAGSLAFSTLKTNGDPQYYDSDDMGTICTKTQAILNVISETQVRLGRGLTKKEIDGVVYEEVGKGIYDPETGKWKHGATPCPPCYVYATWVNKPARLEMIRQYQEKFKDWTDEQINTFMNKPLPSSKKAVTEAKRQRLWISTCLADKHTDPETGEVTWTRKENPSVCPNEILLDLRRSGDMAVQYPGTWTFMQKGGNAQGKAIAPYSDSRMGETIVGKAIGAAELNRRLLEDARNANNPDYIPQYLNPFLVGADAPNAEEANKLAKEYYKKAVEKTLAQNVKGGQRWQSWSDGRAEWGSDYLMEMLTMQALGAKVQTYTKVPEFVPLLASAGFEVNLSLMPDGDGFKHNKDGSFVLDENGNKILAFSPVTGINPEAAEAYVRQYGEKGNVQAMVVGISDEHIRAALASDYITFVIPFHGSGGSVKRLQHLMRLLAEKMDSGNDYTKAQTDKFISGEVNTNPNWLLREAIITGEYDSLTDKQKDDIDDNEYLRKLYEDRYLNEDSEAYQVFFTKSDAQQIFPYEYWDKNTTLATADKNSRRFIEYCEMLGVVPRFSGLQKSNGTEYANFSGRKVENGVVTYDPVPGYWKLLIDRPMYRRVYDTDGKLIPGQCTYRDPEVVNVGNVEVTAMPMAANNTVGHSDDDTREIAGRVVGRLATTGYQNMTLGNTPSVEKTENAPVIKKAMYADSNVQLSGPGDLSDEEMDQIIEELDQDQLEKEQAKYPSSAVKLQTYQTPEQQETVKEYLGAVDERLLDAVKTYKNDRKAPDKRITLSSVTDDQASEIKRVTGFDVSGYKHDIHKSFFIHNEDRHGENGDQDHTMADPNDVARIGWVIENYDNVEPAIDQKTQEIALSYGYMDKNDKPMPMVRYSKKVDNTLFVVEAVGENKWKKLHVVSAYMMTKNNPAKYLQDNAVTRMPHADEGLGHNVQNAYASPAYEIITQPENDVNGQASLGGDLSDTELDQLMVQTGLINPEMVPYSYLPSENVTFGTKQRQFGSKTAQESDALHEQVKEYLYNNSSYIPDTNAEQIDRALGWVQSHATENDPDGYYASLKEVMDPDFNYRTADGQAKILSVMGMAALKADHGDERALQDEIDLADAYNRQGTDLGQALQVRKLFRMMTPVGRKAVLQREADRMNQNLADLGKKYRVSIPDELLEEAANAKTEADFENARNKIRKALNEQLPVTWGERIIGWRMLSMLSAPKTHIRNVGGNMMFVPVVGTKNKVAAVIEAGLQKFGKLDKDERTKTIGFANPAARKFASSRANDIKEILRGNAKYGEGDKRQQERKIFGTKDNAVSKTFGKALQWWYDANGKALEWEDWIFLKYHYTRALGGYMTARGLKPEDMKGTVLEDADLYAIQEAHKATYRDDSPVANWMNRIGSKKSNADNNKALSVIQWIVNTRFPFKRTPINIAKRGIEYSPVGLAKSLTYDARCLKQYLDAKNGKLEKMPKTAISPTQWIDKFASGLTGTGIMIAGVIAAALGLARAGFDKNDPDDQIAKMAGEQEYSIHPGRLTGLELIDEDVSMTLDWAAPVVLPFFTGVGLKEYFEKKGFSVGGTLDLMMEVTDPMMNMSFMSGVSDLFKNNNYSTKDGFWQFAEKTGINFLTSLIPTWSGQIASTIGGRKTTYSGGESLTGDPDIDKMIQQIGNKIPWLNLGGVPYTNDLGEEQEPVIASWAENLLSPAYFSRVDESPEMKELSRLYLVDPQDNKTILPAQPKKTIRIDGADISLNGEQYTKLKADHGAVWRSTVQSLIENPLYENASDDSRAAMFDLADQYATQVAKYMTDSRYKMDSWAESAYNNGNAGDVIINKVAAKNKQYYVEGQAKSFAEALLTGNEADIVKYADELTEAHASASDVRKQLTTYFKPLYKQAYQQGDETTMETIEYILGHINTYVKLDKSITKYTKKKDFDKWITSADTVSDEEDEDENDWLNP